MVALQSTVQRMNMSTKNICYVIYYEKLCDAGNFKSRSRKPTTKTISPKIPLGLAATEDIIWYDIWDTNAIGDQVLCLV